MKKQVYISIVNNQWKYIWVDNINSKFNDPLKKKKMFIKLKADLSI